MSSCPNSTAGESDSPPVRCDDESTWRHRGERIDLARLLELIEENGGPEGLDLHGAWVDGVDARPEALRPHLETYAQKRGADAAPPWLSEARTISLRTAHLESATLTYAHLEKADLMLAQLQGATLAFAHLQSADLPGAQLQKANLSDANLEGADLSFALLEGAALPRACLRRVALPLAHLEKAILASADLQHADLANAHLESADLRFANLESADLWHTRLEHADLADARLHAALWYECYLDRTQLRRESLGSAIGDELAAKGHASRRYVAATFHHAREAYLTLKTNFDSIGRYDDASWAYVKEQQMEKAMYFPTTAGHEWIRKRLGGAVPPPWWGPRHVPRWLWWKLRSAFYHCRLFLGFCPGKVRQDMARRDEKAEERNEWLSRWRWARNWTYELLTGYGERVHMPVIWAGVVVLVFALIYAAAGNIASGDVGALQSHPTHSPITAFTHSISAFATVGFNTLEPVGWGARLLTALEAMFGIGLFALFVFTLGNRMRRS